MSENSKFRAALGGFNRTDVVNYIESSSAEQQKQLRKLQEENEKLKSEKNALAEMLAAANGELKLLREQNASYTEQIALLTCPDDNGPEADELPSPEADAPVVCDEPACEEAPAPAPTIDYTSLELEAYRRAEQTERNATLRAEKVHQQLADLCERAHTRYSDAGAEIAALAEDLSANLTRLQETLADLQLVSDEAENAFDEMALPQQD